ncbi:MAG: type II toxin-antitoxin system VapC family toxin [Planctomycetales bacterium]
MRYVLDSSVALKIVLPEPDSAKAIQLHDDFRNGIHELITLDVFPIEVGHALTRAERQRRITPSSASALWQQIMADCPAVFPSIPLMPRALDLSSQARIGVYDCLYVALGEQAQCEVVSGDQRLVNTFPGQVIPLSSL